MQSDHQPNNSTPLFPRKPSDGPLPPALLDSPAEGVCCFYKETASSS